MQPTAAQLKVIFENKAAVARELKKYIKPVSEFAKDAGLAELRQEEEHLFLEKHYFGKDTGLLPIIEKLIEINGLLLSYEKPVNLGTGFLRYYDKMIELVRDEQVFLINYFKKTLLDVLSHKGFKDYWDKSFSTYESFLKMLRLDLSYFSLALQLQTKTTVHWIVNLIHDGKIDEALAYVESHQGQKILSEEEIDFFRRYIASINAGYFEKAKKLLEEGKELLEEDEIKLMLYSLNQKLIPIIRVLILRPLNSLPDNAIDIVSAYHQERRDALEIGKSDQCYIIIVDSPVNDDVQAEIMFARNKNKFVIIISKNSILKINNNIIEKKYAFLEDDCIININGYEFSVNIKATDKINISPEDYNRLFENKILRLKREEVTAIQLAKALAKEAEQWDLINKELPEIRIPIPIDKMPQQIESAIEKIEEVAPEVEKVPEVKKLEKSKFKGIRINLRPPRKAKEGYKNRREALQRGLIILKNSINLRKKLDEILSSRISQRLQLELKNLQELIKKLEAKKIEFPDFTQQLERLKTEANGLINQVQEAISKVRIMSRQTANHLLSSASEGRKHIEWFLENIGKPRISRRQLLRGLGIAGIATAVGGSSALLARKKPETKPQEESKKEVQQEELDLKFNPVTLSEVNKTIYTEGSYKNATYIVVVPHSTELNALIAARQECRGPITYVAGNNDRNLKIIINGRRYQIDPNRAFCAPGIVDCFQEVNGRQFNGLRNDEQSYLFSVLKGFTDEIDRRIYHGKMVLALHQNTRGSYGIRSYRNLPYSKHAAAININPNELNDVFAYVNARGWFETLKAKGWNVILQGNKKEHDDGSLSYATTWRGLPYINIEVDIGNSEKQAEMIRTVNELIDKYPQLATDINFVPPIQNKNRNKVYLTIDDGPTPLMKEYVNYFIANNIQAIFFCVGQNLEYHSNVAVKSIRQGFIIANHSYSHPHFSKISEARAYAEIKKTDEIIESLYAEAGIKIPIKLFRFPYGDKGGDKSGTYAEMLSKLGYENWSWTKDTVDWKKPPLTNVLQRLSNLSNGDVILLHDRDYTYHNLLQSICNCIGEQGFVTALPIDKGTSPISLVGNENILLIGSDLREGTEKTGERGDSLTLIRRDTQKNLIKILTIPRDTYVYINGKKDKINHALAFGGWKLQNDTVEKFLGIKVDKLMFLDLKNLRDIFYHIRQAVGNEIILDVYKKLGFSTTRDVIWEDVFSRISTREGPESSIGRAKRHARIVAAAIELGREYYKDTSKANLFDDTVMNRLLSFMRYTNMTAEDIRKFVIDLASSDYRIELYSIPGKWIRVNGIVYWEPLMPLGFGNYFTKVVNDRTNKFT